MMFTKSILVVSILLVGFSSTRLYSQSFSGKPAIDSTAIENWPIVSAPLISDDGNYIAYTLNNIPRDSKTLVVKATNGYWKKEFIGADLNLQIFTSNCKFAIIKMESNMLKIITLGENTVHEIPNIHVCFSNLGCDKPFIAYKLNKAERIVHLLNINENEESIISGVSYFSFARHGEAVIYLQIDSLQKKPQLSKIIFAGKIIPVKAF